MQANSAQKERNRGVLNLRLAGETKLTVANNLAVRRVLELAGGPRTAANIVAVADPVEAIELIRSKAAAPIDEIEDLGRVSNALLTTLKLGTRQFVRA